MARQARRSGGTTRRASQPAPTTFADTQATSDTQALPVAELLDERTLAIDERTPAHGGFGLARSLPGALVATFLVAGLAFGAALGPTGLLGSKTDDGAGANVLTAGGDEVVEKTPKPTDKLYVKPSDKPAPDGEATAKPEAEPTAKPAAESNTKPKPDATPKPDKKTEPKPDPKPDSNDDQIGISVAIHDGYPVVAWDACDGDFDYYKVVRSKDSTVTWPTGDNDKVIAAVEPGGKRKAWDKHSPDGVKLWYRVFCVRKTDGTYKVVGASATKAIAVPDQPDPTPPPDPITLSLAASLTAEGKVALSWSACNVDGFAFYKLVRANHDNPSYFPWTDGSEVIAAIGDVNATSWLDKPAAGGTVYYRVQCLGYYGDGKVLLGQSAVVAVAMP